MASSQISIAVVGTLDSKLGEYLYLRSQILHHNPSINVVLIDAGRAETVHEAITIPQGSVLAASGYQGGNGTFQSLLRGEIIKTMIGGAVSVVRQLHDRGEIQAIIGLGGSGGTSIAAAVMRELPLMFPKLIVSTVASGDTSSYVGETDITMMYSVVDIAGLNEVLKAVVDNAAAAIVGMAKAYVERRMSQGRTEEGTKKKKKGIGITMFGVTTAAVDVARRVLSDEGFEVYVFHATGAGGRAMERLVRERRLDGILDLTTTELADELMGGVFSAGESRLTEAAKAGIPQIVSVGALDMVNFGPMDTVPKDLRGRKLFEHNPSVTLMRTTPEECRDLGKRLTQRLMEHCTKPGLVEVWLPLRGISAIAVEGQAFYYKEADNVLFATVKNELSGSGIKVVEVDADINDPTWAEKIAWRLKDMIDQGKEV